MGGTETMNEEAKEKFVREFSQGKLTTIQKRNNLSEIHRWKDRGPGNAWHRYLVRQVDSGGGVVLVFQEGPRNDPHSSHGLLDADLLEIVRDRLKCFQDGEYRCRENACALTHIEEALMWMNKRVEDRAERNVLGTYET